MKPKYSIGLFVLIVSIIYIVSVTIPNETEDTHEESVSTDGEVSDRECFYLYSLNGYLIVYAGDNKTVYEYTDIPTDNLPETIQLEIKNGKFIESKEELYGFLENYSS